MIIMNNKNEIGIDEDGFINKTDLHEYVSKAYYSEVELICKVNKYMYSLYEKMEPTSTDVIGCFFANAYSKIHKNIQGATIVATRGLQDQGKVLVRSTLDKLLIMQAVSNDKNNYNKWLKSQKFETNRLIKAIRRGDEGLAHLQKQVSMHELLPESENVTQKEWAEMANMMAEYNIVYRLFSGNVHYSKGSFDDEFYFKDGIIVAMDIAPKVDEIGKLLFTTTKYALKSALIVRKYFSLDDAEYDELVSCLKKAETAIIEGMELEL